MPYPMLRYLLPKFPTPGRIAQHFLLRVLDSPVSGSTSCNLSWRISRSESTADVTIRTCLYMTASQHGRHLSKVAHGKALATACTPPVCAIRKHMKIMLDSERLSPLNGWKKDLRPLVLLNAMIQKYSDCHDARRCGSNLRVR